jgi:uncharacterized protein YggE
MRQAHASKDHVPKPEGAIMHAILTPALAVLVLSMPAFAQTAAAQEVPRQITVTGEGSSSAKPDLAWVNIGVTHTAKTAEEAVAMMSQGMESVMQRLNAAGIAAADIQTGQLSLYPTYEDSSYSRSSEVNGYTASIAVDVRVRELAKLGGILDAVVQDGANTFGGIRFDLDDPSAAYSEARRDAVADGRAKAELFAEAAGVTLGDLVTLSESNWYSAPAMAAPRLEADASSVPVAPGEVSYASSVTMVYAIE